MLFQHSTLNCQGRLVDLDSPLVMGILNITPDSFYDGGLYHSEKVILTQVEKMLSEGATFIDIGGMSSRPGAVLISARIERNRVVPAIEKINKEFPEAFISIDTFRASVAKAAVEAGAVLINDISAGNLDEKMFSTVAALGVPYVLMHMQGEPATMQNNPSYENVLQDILDFFILKLGQLKELGVKDVILDVGFGFGKTLEDNYKILNNLSVYKMLELPLLVGISRKSMIYKLLKVGPEEALNGTTALHMIALQQGAKILRVHDVQQANECITLWQMLEH